MRFDAIVVPRGAEAQAVRRGWPEPRPPLLTVPAGATAGTALAGGTALGKVLVLGLCGALDPALRVGDTVIYGRVVDGANTMELDPELAEACARVCGRAPLDAAAVANVVGEVAAKAALRAATFAAVIDMEAAALARALERRGGRVAMVRIVSDAATRELPDFGNVYDAGGALRPLVMMTALARTPLRGARFIADVFTALGALRATARRFALDANA